MTSYTESINQLTLGIKQQQDQDDALKCPKCNFTYFEEVQLQQYSKESVISPGQKPQSLMRYEFFILRCTDCGTYSEPYFTHSSYDRSGDVYASVINRLTKNNNEVAIVTQPSLPSPPPSSSAPVESKKEVTKKKKGKGNGKSEANK